MTHRAPWAARQARGHCCTGYPGSRETERARPSEVTGAVGAGGAQDFMTRAAPGLAVEKRARAPWVPALLAGPREGARRGQRPAGTTGSRLGSQCACACLPLPSSSHGRLGAWGPAQQLPCLAVFQALWPGRGAPCSRFQAQRKAQPLCSPGLLWVWQALEKVGGG